MAIDLIKVNLQTNNNQFETTLSKIKKHEEPLTIGLYIQINIDSRNLVKRRVALFDCIVGIDTIVIEVDTILVTKLILDVVKCQTFADRSNAETGVM